MKVFSVHQIQQADAYTIENEPINSIDLMERASSKLFEFVVTHYNSNESFVVFAGPGNNGGDALALARMLLQSTYTNCMVYLLNFGTRSADCELNYKRLLEIENHKCFEIHEGDAFPQITNEAIIIDGIFGSGLSRPVTGYWGKLIDFINKNATEIIAIDIPSGLFGEDNATNRGSIIQANLTLSFQFPKLAFFFAENDPFVGAWQIRDIGLHKTFIEETLTDWHYLESHEIAMHIKQRKRFSHKGDFGHAFLIAGSYQMTGAAILASKACLRSGAGLLTSHVPKSSYEIMQTAVPEAMVCIDESELEFCEKEKLNNYTAIGIGPGIGKKKSRQQSLLKLIENYKKPIVFDADALNILAENKSWIRALPVNSILTPHPGEFDRLTQKHFNGFERFVTQQRFSIENQVVVILKGANTSISLPNGKIFFNATGNSGMATAGSGDVLTGIILSLLAQGYLPEYASKLGVCLHGLAGDLALAKFGAEALIASDIINNLGFAFVKLKQEK